MAEQQPMDDIMELVFGKDVKVDQATKTWVMEQVNRYQADYQNQNPAKGESGKSETNWNVSLLTLFIIWIKNIFHVNSGVTALALDKRFSGFFNSEC